MDDRGRQAFDARELAAVLAGERDLMERYKRAAGEGRVEAIRLESRNLTVIEDADLVARLLEAAPRLRPRPV